MTTFHAPRRRGKLPARYAAIVMPLVLSVLMTFVVSAIEEPWPNAHLSKHVACRMGTIVDRCVSDVARGASAGAPDRGVRAAIVQMLRACTAADVAHASLTKPVRDHLAHDVRQRFIF